MAFNITLACCPCEGQTHPASGYVWSVHTPNACVSLWAAVSRLTAPKSGAMLTYGDVEGCEKP